MLALHERIARDGMLGPGKSQRDRSRATGYQDAAALQGAALHGKRISGREPGHAVKGIDPLAREVLLELVRDRVSEAPLEGDQLLPIDSHISRDTVPMHPPRQVDRLCAAHQHLLGIAAAQGARAAEWTVIDHGDRAARFADASRRDLCGRACAYDEEVIRIHGSSSAEAAAVESERDQAEAEDHRRDHHVIGLGEPASETDGSEHDHEQVRRATDIGEHGADGSRGDERALAHGSISSLAPTGSPPWWWRR